MEIPNGVNLVGAEANTPVENRTWHDFKDRINMLLKRGEYREISLTEAVDRIDKAPSIIEDRGVNVFGHEVEDPLAAAVKYLQESLVILEKKEDGSVNCGRVHEQVADILARDTTHDGKVDQNEWEGYLVKLYGEAAKIYHRNSDMDRYWRADDKVNAIKAQRDITVLRDGTEYRYRPDLVARRKDK